VGAHRAADGGATVKSVSWAIDKSVGTMLICILSGESGADGVVDEDEDDGADDDDNGDELIPASSIMLLPSSLTDWMVERRGRDAGRFHDEAETVCNTDVTSVAVTAAVAAASTRC